MTNREKQMEKIRTMSDEEFAMLIMPDDCIIDPCPARGYCQGMEEDGASECIEILTEWLKMEAEQ